MTQRQSPSALSLEPGDDLRPLSALVDGELSESERQAIEETLRSHPAHADKVAHYREQSRAIKALFPLPADVPSLFIRRRVPWWRWAGVAAACLVLGLALGWMLPALMMTEPAFARRADLAYVTYAPEQRHPVEVVAADQLHLVQWLSKRLNRPFVVPSLQEYGYTLVGGRLLPGESGPAALLMYQNATAERLTLYVTAASQSELDIKVLRHGAHRTVYWASRGMGYAVSGQGDEASLRELAADVCVALGGSVSQWQSRG